MSYDTEKQKINLINKFLFGSTKNIISFNLTYWYTLWFKGDRILYWFLDKRFQIPHSSYNLTCSNLAKNPEVLKYLTWSRDQKTISYSEHCSSLLKETSIKPSQMNLSQKNGDSAFLPSFSSAPFTSKLIHKPLRYLLLAHQNQNYQLVLLNL